MKKAGIALTVLTLTLVLLLCQLTACSTENAGQGTEDTADTSAATAAESAAQETAGADTEPAAVSEEPTEAATEAETSPYRFEAPSPADGEEVVLAPKGIYDWYAQYTSSEAYFSSAAVTRTVPNNYPVAVTLSWSFSADAEAYTLTYGLKPDLTDGSSVTLTKAEAKLEDLFVSTAYYWQVSTEVGGETVTSAVWSFRTADTPRLLNVRGLENARDLGGAATSFGVPIRQGMAYRTGNVEGLSANSIREFTNRYGIRTELDLRYVTEINGRTESVLGADVNYVSIPSGQYFQIYTNAYPDAFKNALLLFADEANYPIDFHCSAGRDRTGMIAAVLYALCGADEVAVVRDYEATFLKNTTNVSLPDEPCTEKLGGFFLPFLTQMKRTYGTDDLRTAAERLCLDIGLCEADILNIRKNLLGDAFENVPVASPLPAPTPYEEQETPVVSWSGDAIAADLIAQSTRENIGTVTCSGDYVTVSAAATEGIVYLFQGTAAVRTAPVLAVRYRTDSLPADAYFEVFAKSDGLTLGAGDNMRAAFESDGEWHTLILDLASGIANFNGTYAHTLRLDLYNRASAGQTIDYAFVGLFTGVEAAEAYMAGYGQ